MNDKYFHPTTIAKCHERIEQMLHTNKTQAEHIATLQSRLHAADLENGKLGVSLTMAQNRHKLLLADWRALKGVLAMLSKDEALEHLPTEVVFPVGTEGVK